MRVEYLRLANVRSIKAAEFRFIPGINLIGGVNGVGKTGVLDALGVCLSFFIRDVYDLRTDFKRFGRDDVRLGSTALYVECSVRHGGADYVCDVRKQGVMDGRRGVDSPQTITGNSMPPPSAEHPGGLPLAVLFSTRRAVASRRAPSKTAAGGVAAACAGAFANRELQLNEFGHWMLTRQRLAAERPAAADVLTAVARTVARCLPGYSNFRVDGDKRPELLIDHGDMALKVSQLSDGERGMLAMVLDLTRRLAQANPALADPGRGSGGGRSDRRDRPSSAPPMAATDRAQSDNGIPLLSVYRYDALAAGDWGSRARSHPYPYRGWGVLAYTLPSAWMPAGFWRRSWRRIREIRR